MYPLQYPLRIKQWSQKSDFKYREEISQLSFVMILQQLLFSSFSSASKGKLSLNLWNMTFSESSVGRLPQYLQFPGPSPSGSAHSVFSDLGTTAAWSLLSSCILFWQATAHIMCFPASYRTFLGGQLVTLQSQHSNGFKKSCELAVVCIPFYITVNSEHANVLYIHQL